MNIRTQAKNTRTYATVCPSSSIKLCVLMLLKIAPHGLYHEDTCFICMRTHSWGILTQGFQTLLIVYNVRTQVKNMRTVALLSLSSRCKPTVLMNHVSCPYALNHVSSRFYLVSSCSLFLLYEHACLCMCPHVDVCTFFTCVLMPSLLVSSCFSSVCPHTV